MRGLSEEQRRGIERALRQAGADLPCPRCGHDEAVTLDGYLLESRQSQLRNLVISGDNRLACVATVCARCGYLAQHVLDALGG
jgi:ribosomal protein S27AE